MSNKTQSNIEALENKVEELLALSKKLSTENTELKQQLKDIRGDRAHLVEQRETVRTQVEGMITRLKTIETA
ncbi:MAG: TIGR02449 family protein [Gammaproteobacteria bacterium]|nr:TIGR02449 family protein [Gammaproteobacteria bacterium]